MDYNNVEKPTGFHIKSIYVREPDTDWLEHQRNYRNVRDYINACFDQVRESLMISPFASFEYDYHIQKELFLHLDYQKDQKHIVLTAFDTEVHAPTQFVNYEQCLGIYSRIENMTGIITNQTIYAQEHNLSRLSHSLYSENDQRIIKAYVRSAFSILKAEDKKRAQGLRLDVPPDEYYLPRISFPDSNEEL